MKRALSIAVAGGGAAGFFAALRAAEVNPDAEIHILEQSKQVLTKVKVSGGGRCNVTHACWEPKALVKAYPRGSRELLGPFHKFAPGDMIAWLDDHGVRTKIEEDGRIFPESDESQTIIDCFVEAARKAGIRVHTGSKVKFFTTLPKGGFRITTDDRTFAVDRLIIAAGGSNSMWQLLEKAGHTIVPPVPSLFTFNSHDRALSGLEGIVLPEVTVSVPGTRLSETGPVLITHVGFSGPAILRLSAWGARELNRLEYKFTLAINLMPGMTATAVKDQVMAFRHRAGKRKLKNASPAWVPERFWKNMTGRLEESRDKNWADLTVAELEQAAGLLGNMEFEIWGKSTFKEEFVTAGGVDLKEVDFRTMESKKVPGLYLAGEVLDIDAITGGYNFQAAWTTGWMAGGSAGTIIME